MKVIYNKFIPFKGFLAINILGVVFARKEYKPLKWQTLNHEAIHTAQMREMLYIFFYSWYILEWCVKLCKYGKNSYRNLSFEREAYTHQYDESYLQCRHHYAWWKKL
jgi:hypothetical protein